MSEEVDALAGLLHEEMCGDHAVPAKCARWNNPAGSSHKQYYIDRARNLIDQLEPVIGIANVFTAVKVIIEELM
jgi:hypothetical protein